jgi:hypothetical protein
VLLFVAVMTWQDEYKSHRWREPLYVSIYPIAADDSVETRRYLDSLDEPAFKPIDAFFKQQAGIYRLKIDDPFKTRLRKELKEKPPQRPESGFLATVLWSLKLRYWAWRVSGHAGEPEDVRLFVLYHSPEATPSVPHSLGLTKGLIGVIYAFASKDMSATNDVVIAHELLHTVGASDKYDPQTDAPLFPIGYGDPTQKPLLPQHFAEIMAGRIVIGAGKFEQAESLDQVVLGGATALEIRWPQPAK